MRNHPHLPPSVPQARNTLLRPLCSSGIKNVRALHELVEAQKVGYDFTYFNVDFPCDASVLSISTSKVSKSNRQ